MCGVREACAAEELDDVFVAVGEAKDAAVCGDAPSTRRGGLMDDYRDTVDTSRPSSCRRH